MKKVFLVALLAIGVSAASFAQGGGRGARTPEQQMEALKASVTGITADQSTKIMAIYTASTKSQDSLRTAGGDQEAMRTARTTLRTASDAKIRAILTADQQKAFDARPQFGRGGQGGPGGAPGGAPRP